MIWTEPLAGTDRTLAALGHIAILLPGLGLLVPVMVWTTARQRSPGLRFQLMQAAGAQVILPVVSLLASLIVLILTLLAALVVGLVLRGQGAGVESALALLGIVRIVAAVLIFLIHAVFLGLGLAAAIICLTGKTFRYPFLGTWLEQFLSRPEGEREQTWLAAVCHAGIFAGLGGLISALVVWISHKERGQPLAFQSLQAAVYQALGLAAGLILGTGLALLAGISAAGLIRSGSEFSGLAGLLTASSAFLALVCLGLLVLILPFYQTLPLVAAYRLLNGREYNYPLLGSWLRSRAAPALNQAAG